MEPRRFASKFLEDDVQSMEHGSVMMTSRDHSPSPSRCSFSRRSSESERSLSPNGPSCVTLSTDKNDCATQRFIVWAAVERNASSRIVDDVRLECPLLRCNRRFRDHESMLRHLVGCRYLASCEYWCFEHSRIERFDDSRCQKCLCHLSKRRKIMSMAKHFFTGLGHNKTAKDAQGAVPASPSMSVVSALTSSSSSSFSKALVCRNDIDGSDSSGMSHSNSHSSSHTNCSSTSNTSSSSTSRRNNSFRHGDDQRFSVPRNAFVPPHSESSMPGHVELPSTEIIQEIDSKELTMIPQPRPQSQLLQTQPPQPQQRRWRPRNIARTVQNTVHSSRNTANVVPTVPAGPSPMTSSMTSVYPSFSPVSAIESSPSMGMPPMAPAPQTTLSHAVPPPAIPSALPPTLPPNIASIPPPTSFPMPQPTQASIDPKNLVLAELGSSATCVQDLMEWECAGSSMPSMSSVLADAESASLTNFSSVMDFQVANTANTTNTVNHQMQPFSDNMTSHPMPPPRQPSPVRQMHPTASAPSPRSKNLSPSSSVRSTTSTTSTDTTVSTMSTASNVSNISSVSSATSMASCVTDWADFGSNGAPLNLDCEMDVSLSSTPGSSGLETCLTSPTDDFRDVFESSLFVGDQFLDPDMCNGSSTSASSSSSSGVLPETLNLPPELPYSPKPIGDIPDVTITIPDQLLLTYGMNALEMDGGSGGSGVSEVSGVSGISETGTAGATAITPEVDPQEVSGTTAERTPPDTPPQPTQQELAYEAQTLVTSAYDLLLTHIATSLKKLRGADANNSLARLLLETRPTTIASTAIQALQSSLVTTTTAASAAAASATAAASTTPAFSALCLLHLVYSFSLVVYGPLALDRSEALFGHLVAYAQNFAEPTRQEYLDVASRIWKPKNMSAAHLSQRIQQCQDGRGPETACMDNSVLATAGDFLDGLEMAMTSTLPWTELPTSSLVAKHAQYTRDASTRPAFVVSVESVTRDLQRQFSDVPDMAARFDSMCHRASTGAFLSVRRLELELLREGKATLGSCAAFFDDYAPRAKRLCDPIYAQLEPPAHQRSAYYESDIGLFQSIMANVKEEDSGLGIVLKASRKAAKPLRPAEAQIQEQAPALSTAKTKMDRSAPQGTTAREETSRTDSDSDKADKSDKADAKVEVESDACCALCGYRPKGEPKWFRGSMAKHMRTKHSSKEKVYKCPYPGCKSQYRNRKDNLRQHQIEKNHWVGDEVAATKKKRRRTNQGDGRPNKLQKV